MFYRRDAKTPRTILKTGIPRVPIRKYRPLNLCVSASRWLIALLSVLVAACSIPNLESQECIEARTTVREFYSFHFGNDLKYSPADLDQREKFLTTEFANKLRAAEPETDPFTLTSDTPKAFRIGECQTIEAERKVSFDVLLFWKTDERTEQRTIKAEAVIQDDSWLVNAVKAN